MRDILSLDSAHLAGLSFDCDCGRTHSVRIRKIDIGRNKAADIPALASAYGKKIFLSPIPIHIKFMEKW